MAKKETRQVKVDGCVLGGIVRSYEVGSIADVRKALGVGSEYRITVNGEEVLNNFVLSEDDYVSAAEAVKGGK